MVDTTYLILALIIVFDFVASLWNAYASGVVWGLLRHQPGHGFEKACAIAGLGLAFSGMAYSTTIILGWATLQLGLLAAWDFVYLASFDFLFFGAMIIGFGLVVTAQSVAIAYRQRNWGSIAVAGWNMFAEVWDIATYVRGFQSAATVVKGQKGRGAVVAVLAAAVSIALIITYFAFRAGLQKSVGAIADSPQQSAADANAPPPSEAGHHRALRRAVFAGVAVLVVVIVLLLALRYVVPPPQVNVAEIDVWAPDNVCGLAGQPISYGGFTDPPGSADAFQLQVQNFNNTSCTLHEVTTNTSGFALSSVQVPVTVAAGQSQFLNLTVNLPPASYDGTLSLVYT